MSALASQQLRLLVGGMVHLWVSYSSFLTPCLKFTGHKGSCDIRDIQNEQSLARAVLLLILSKLMLLDGCMDIWSKHQSSPASCFP